MSALKCFVDSDVVWVGVGIDDRRESDPLFPAVLEHRFGFRSVDRCGITGLCADRYPDQVVLCGRDLVHLKRAACAQEWCSGSANNVWHSSGIVLPWMRVVRMYRWRVNMESELHPIEASELHARRERVFLVVSGLFLGSLTMLNVLGLTRFIDLSFTVFGFEVPMPLAVGVLPYPVTFLCTDIISEMYCQPRP